MRFTQRAFLFGFVAFCFYLVGVVNALPSYFYVLTWLTIGLVLASFALALLALVGLEFSWSTPRPRGAAGFEALATPNSPRLIVDELDHEMVAAPPLIEIEVINRGSFNKTSILIEFEAQLHGGADVGSAARPTAFLIEALPAGRTARALIPLASLSRGVHRIERVRLIGSDVLGLFRTHRTLALPEPLELIVAPPHLVLSGRTTSGGRRRIAGSRAHRRNRGDEVRALRPYAMGDDLRHVHWKSSARSGELVVRDWEQPGRAISLIVWSAPSPAAPASSNRTARSDSRDSLTWADEASLSLAASLAALWLSGGSPTALWCLDATPRATSSSSPGEEGALPRAFLEVLARAQGHHEGFGVAVETLDETRRAGHSSGQTTFDRVALVTARLDKDALDWLALRRDRESSTLVLLVAETGASTGSPELHAHLRALGVPVHEVALTPDVPLSTQWRDLLAALE